MLTNQNVADISVLETLQDSANVQMGVGNMSVFNAKPHEADSLYHAASDITPEDIQRYVDVKCAVNNVSVVNATFLESRKLTPEESKLVEKSKSAILDAEKKYRAEDDRAIQQQKQASQKAQQLQKTAADELKKATGIFEGRVRSLKKFESGKAAMESALKQFGVTVKWDEPKTDATHIDVQA